MELPATYRRALVVFAHPDDAEFGMAGTVARLVEHGLEVIYVQVTDGSKGTSDPNVPPHEIAAIRAAEQREAACVLGVREVVFLGYEDGLLEVSLDLRRAIVAEIRRWKPDIVICQHPARIWGTGSIFINHPDHIACGEATLAAVYPSARDHLVFPDLLQQGLEPHKVREVWLVTMREADFFVDVTPTVEKKIAALLCHHSQVGGRGPELAEMIKKRLRERAEGTGYEYAEGFSRIKIG